MRSRLHTGLNGLMLLLAVTVLVTVGAGGTTAFDEVYLAPSAPGGGDPGAVFAKGPNMKSPRMRHLTVTLPDGRVALFGGHGTGFKSLNTAEIWTPATNRFTRVAMKFRHDAAGIARLNDGRYLLAGGLEDLGVTPGYDTAEIFDPIANTFTATAGTMKYKRAYCAAATLNSGKVLVAGGTRAELHAPECEKYADLFNPDTGSFTATKALKVPRYYCLVLPCKDGKAVVLGGSRPEGGSVAEVELYNPSTNSFRILSNNLFGKEKGWYVAAISSCPIEANRLADGKYLYWAVGLVDGVWEYRLFTFDPASKKIVRFDTTPALPDGDTVVLDQPVVDKANNRAYLLGLLVGKDPTQFRVYSVDLATKTLVVPTGSHTLPKGQHVDGAGLQLLQDGRIFVTGGHSKWGTEYDYSAINKTLFATYREGY
ncbi:MAG: kelch repeat-containing protein [Acidobacteriota bacterium]